LKLVEENDMTTDKKTIGLTPDNKKRMDTMMDTGLFKEQIHVAKLAVSIAINADIVPSSADKAETVWNVGSFDSDGKLRDMMRILFSDIETPYRAIEHLLNEGLVILAKSVEDNGDLDLSLIA
jgi:hypothetical protein